MTGGTAVEGCLFCWAVEGGEGNDAERLVLYRGRHNFVIINRYPYNNGHLMVAPFAHVADLAAASDEQLQEMMLLARACERILGAVYDPDGFNLGMNLGSASGAGIADHQHLHIVPRWLGDTNFLTTTDETRVVPELPESTWQQLRGHFEALRLAGGD